jgi:hypothetical protein
MSGHKGEVAISPGEWRIIEAMAIWLTRGCQFQEPMQRVGQRLPLMVWPLWTCL